MANATNIKLHFCTCSVETMAPVYDPTLDYRDGEKRCENCKGIVTWFRNDHYNRYYGYSGYDEYNDGEVE